jgi:N-acetylmuramoyl-L-alanine amidase
MIIVSREIWGALPPKKSYSKNIAKQMGLAVHYTAMETAISYEDELQQLKNIQKFHQVDRGWNDIGYSFIVGNSGNVYEGRGFGNRPASQGTNDGNKNYYSICWLGDAEGVPSQAALNSIKALWKHIGGEVKPHKEFKQTSCPGLYLSNWIEEIKTVDPKEVVLDSLIEERVAKLEKELSALKKVIDKRAI